MKRLLARHMFPWLSQKCAGKRFRIRSLEARETEDIPLVKLTPMVVEMGHYDLTNGSVIEVMLGRRSHGMVGQNRQPIPGRSADYYGYERDVSSMCSPAVHAKWPNPHRHTTSSRYRTLKKLLTTSTDQPEEVQAPELLDDHDPHLLSPAEDEEK